MDQWWFSGPFKIYEFDADLVLDEKSSAESRAQVNYLERDNFKEPDYLKKPLEAFLEFNNKSQIAFMTAKEVDPFIREFKTWCINYMNASEKEKKEALGLIDRHTITSETCDDNSSAGKEDPVLVFFNPWLGIEIAKGVNNAFPLPNNPFYNKKNSDDAVINLLVCEKFSVELTAYCFFHCDLELPFFNGTRGSLYLAESDFLLRFFKGRNYRP